MFQVEVYLNSKLLQSFCTTCILVVHWISNINNDIHIILSHDGLGIYSTSSTHLLIATYPMKSTYLMIILP